MYVPLNESEQPMTLQSTSLSIPKVSIIIATYNRANTLSRAVDSVVKQELTDWELIIVDDGSTDNSRAIIESYVGNDIRIRAAYHERNLHVHAAKNTGFNLMRGEWFTTLDSDDEMVPTALSTMLMAAGTLGRDVDAIECNCLDTTTGMFSGRGLDRDQWLDFKTQATKCTGGFWGITKRSMLGSTRFNPQLRGGAESVLWWKIGKDAKRYYIHKALLVYHTEGTDRITTGNSSLNVEDRICFYRELASETEYLSMMRLYQPGEYATIERNIAISLAVAGRRAEAWKAFREAAPRMAFVQRAALLLALLGGRQVAHTVVKAAMRSR
jgi:glycosyltransferase involved in cell wall biosynthesis